MSDVRLFDHLMAEHPRVRDAVMPECSFEDLAPHLETLHAEAHDRGEVHEGATTS